MHIIQNASTNIIPDRVYQPMRAQSLAPLSFGLLLGVFSTSFLRDGLGQLSALIQKKAITVALRNNDHHKMTRLNGLGRSLTALALVNHGQSITASF